MHPQKSPSRVPLPNSPGSPTDDSQARLVDLGHLRRQMIRQAWYSLLGGYALYIIVASITVNTLQSYSMQLAVWVNLIVLLLIVLTATLRFMRRLDAIITQAEQAEVDRGVATYTAQQLEAVQATALTVAHTINQPLTAALGYLALYTDAVPSERDDQDLRRVRHEIERIATLVQQLQEVTEYQTIPYAGGAEMLDLPTRNGNDRSADLYR